MFRPRRRPSSRPQRSRRSPRLKFYFNGSPNPTKVCLFLEEAGLPYEAIPVDTRRGEQFRAEYLAVNPNGKVPAIVDGGVTVFDSNAILHEIMARPAAAKALALKDRHKFKAEMDDDARSHMFKHLAAA